jgi:hypothetical protein
LRNACVALWELPDGTGEEGYLETFNKEQLRLMTPIKIEKENSGRTNLKAGKTYVIIPSLEIKGGKGDFFVNVYFNQ